MHLANDLCGRHVYVVEERVNPSTDFFVLPFLKREGAFVQRLTFNELPNVQHMKNAVVIFIRYVPSKWKQFITSYGDSIRKIYFFMDDDLFDLGAFKKLPLHYQTKLVGLSWRRQQWLKSVNAQLLVSTEYLADKYSVWKPKVLSPVPAPFKVESEVVSIFYHGTGSHLSEIKWLYPVMEQVMKDNENTFFQLFGDASVSKMYRTLERVSVLHPVSWSVYQVMLRQSSLDIGLAPLLKSSFNSARSYTKFFDITMMGGVGIYPENSIYNQVVEHQVNGLLLPMQQEDWVAEIGSMVKNKEQRCSLHQNAKNTYRSLEDQST